MSGERLRVLLIATHPVQYSAPIFRLLAKDPRVEIEVAYCSLQGAEAEMDPDFGVAVKWDVPLLDGYPWKLLPNWFGKPKIGSFFGLFNPGVWRLIAAGKFDAVVLYTGYMSATFWIALLAAKLYGAAVLFGTDAWNLEPRDGKKWKASVKRLLWPRLFGLADKLLAPSSAGVQLMRRLGISPSRVALTPYCVDNSWWIERASQVDRAAVRARWRVPIDAVVMLFCAKLQEWKRPQDVLRAFARLGSAAYLVFVGEGALRRSLEIEADSLGVASRVRFLGFVNQAGLPDVYCAADLLVLPSAYEPFGVVVNEAMLCECAVIVSDRVGARFDLVREGETGFVFPFGDDQALSNVLEECSRELPRLRRMGQEARRRMADWCPEKNVDALVTAIAQTVEFPAPGESSVAT